jgi:hypothetical protein
MMDGGMAVIASATRTATDLRSMEPLLVQGLTRSSDDDAAGALVREMLASETPGAKESALRVLTHRGLLEAHVEPTAAIANDPGVASRTRALGLSALAGSDPALAHDVAAYVLANSTDSELRIGALSALTTSSSDSAEVATAMETVLAACATTCEGSVEGVVLEWVGQDPARLDRIVEQLRQSRSLEATRMAQRLVENMLANASPGEPRRME